MIFSDFQRTDPSPSPHGESDYHFYNRCNSAAAARIRSEIETWLSNYPSSHREELVTRFQEDSFSSAFFELLLHQLLIRHGYGVSIHPCVGTKGRCPDFEVQVPGNDQTLILEATLCLDDHEDDATSGRMSEIYDAINSIDCPFFIMLRCVKLKSRSHQPSTKRIAAYFRELGQLNVQEASQKSPYENELVLIEFELIPKPKEAIESETCTNIAKYPFRMRWGDSTKAGRRTLNAKAKHYGPLDKPFVIAVNTIGPWGYHAREHFETLFGTRQEYVEAQTEELRVRILPDGFWGTNESPNYTRVSGVLFASAHPTNVATAGLCLYRNPWASHPLPNCFWKLPTIDFSENKILPTNAMTTVGQILGLPNDWPGELFPER